MKKFGKKSISLLLSLIMILSVFAIVPVTVNAAPPGGGSGGGIGGIGSTEHTITLYANNGTSESYSKTGSMGSLILAEASYYGFTTPLNKTFTSWNTAADGSGTEYTGYNYSQDLTLYAQWQTTAKRIYAKNNAGWGNFYIYYWGDDYNPVSWPGDLMTESVSDGDTTYLYRDIPIGATKIIFTDNYGGQTSNIESGVEDGAVFIVNGGGDYYSVSRFYSVTWKNGDDTLETDEFVISGSSPSYNGETPTKESTDEYDYTFAGWSDGENTYTSAELPAVTGDVTYTAQFTASVKVVDNTKYRLQFRGAGIKSTTLPCTISRSEWLALSGLYSYDAVPSANVAAGDEEYLSLDENRDLTVLKPFTGTKTINDVLVEGYHYSVTVTCELDVYSIIDNSVNGTVTANVNDTDVTEAAPDDTVLLNVAPDGGYQFKSITAFIPKNGIEDFSDLVALMGNTVAVGEDGYSTCKVEDGKFVIYNGTTLLAEISASDVTNIVFDGSDIVNVYKGNEQWIFYIENNKIILIEKGSSNSDYFCTDFFVSAGALSPVEVALTTVTEGSQYSFTMPNKSVTVKAEFEPVTYTVTWKDWDGEIIEVDEDVAYGTVPSFDGEEPTKAEDEYCRYSFTGWSPEVSAVTDDVTYTAQFSSNKKFVLFGWIEGADYEGLDYTFDENGKLTTVFTQDAYVAIKAADSSEYFMVPNDHYQANPTASSFNFYGRNDWANYQKMFVPANKQVTFTLTGVEGGFNLSYEAPLSLGHSLSLDDGDIGVNFYFNFFELTGEQLEDVKVDFAWDVEGKSKEVKGVSGTLTPNGCKFTCRVAAAEMTYDITATVKVGGEEIGTNTYSVKQYADKILSDEYKDKYVGDDYDELAGLVKAMLDYGTSAQIKWGRNINNLANGGVYFNTEAVDPDSITAYKSDMNAGLDAYGLEYAGSTISLESKTVIRHYYKLTDESQYNKYRDGSYFEEEGVTLTFGGKEVTVNGKKPEIFFETEVNAAGLNDPVTLVIGENSYDYSALDYVKNYLNKTEQNENTAKLVSSLYYYSVAADAYFG